MQVKLKILEGGTVFEYNGKMFKKGCMSWSPVGANFTENDYEGPKNPTCVLRQCEPKLGGQFQSNIDVWFNVDTEVTVN